MKTKILLTKVYADATVFSQVPNVTSYLIDIEPDKRKLKKVVRELMESGYLNLIDGQYQASSKAFKETAETPLEGFDLQNPGIFWCKLSVSTKKYIINNSKSFLFLTRSNYSPIQFNEIAIKQVNYWDLMVTTEEHLKSFQLKEEEDKFNLYSKEYLLLGLQKFGVLKSESTLFSTNSFKNSSSDPLACGEIVTQLKTQLQAEVETLQNKLNELAEFEAALTMIGGWSGFIEKYHSALRKNYVNSKSPAR